MDDGDAFFLGGGTMQPENKVQFFLSESTLFVGTLPRTANENELRSVFSVFGVIADVTILRDKMTGLSKGCAFVKFENREQAQSALDNLNGQCHLEVCALLGAN